MPFAKLVLIIAMLIGGNYILRLMDISPADLWAIAQEKTSQFNNDSKALLSGESQIKIAEKLKAEAGKIASQSTSTSKDDDNDGLNRELAEARKQMMKDRADALEKHATEIFKGDIESLKRRVAENAINAGGQQ